MTLHPSVRLLACLVAAAPSCAPAAEGSHAPSERDLAQAEARYAQAVQALDRGESLEAMDLLDEAVTLDPNCEEAHRARSAFGERVSHFDEVIESTDWLLEREPEDPELLARLLHAGMNAGRMDIARKALFRLKQADPDSARTEALAARFYLEAGDLGNALKHATRSADLVPEQTTAHYVIGLAREYAGESELAIASMRRVIYVDPGHLGARDHLATLLLRLGRRKEASKHREIHTALIRAMPGGFRHFPPRQRIESFSGIVELLPEWDFGYLELARARMENGELQLAKETLEKALAIRPRAPETNELMASILRRMGDEAGAAQYAKLAGVPWADDTE